MDARGSLPSALRFEDGLEPDAGLGGMGGLHNTVRRERECLNDSHDRVVVAVLVVVVENNDLIPDNI